ncbi:MAG TPA: hypothetical protein V6D17_10260 [Candidatus Obscuribacterales bacterium]
MKFAIAGGESNFGALFIAAFVLFAFLLAPFAFAAENLRLREGISFVQDLDNGFPIVADNIDDMKVEAGKPSLIFFGASGDLNTNRQAKRLVDIHKRYQGKLKVILVDVDHPANQDAVKLIKTYYRGYIPLEVILDREGKMAASHVGELESGELKSKIEKVL